MEQNKTTNNTAKTLALHAENGTFNRPSDGKSVSYTNYYVEIMGIKVKLDAKDSTGKQLLEMYYKGANNG